MELRLHFDALEDMIARLAFTQDGRRWLKGNPKTPCDYAYLEKPKLGACQGRLQLQARFSGKSAWDVFGGCLGLGDSFDIIVLADPYYEKGMLRVRNIEVKTREPAGFYARAVCRRLQSSLGEALRYPLQQDAQKMMEENAPGSLYGRQVRDFQVTRVGVEPNALVLSLSFQMDIVKRK
jgi:hypothetical protein